MNKTKNKRLKKFRKTKRGGSWLNSIFGIFKSKPATNGTQPTTTSTNATKPVPNASNATTTKALPIVTQVPNATKAVPNASKNTPK
jgi:hypothetical protein